MGKIKVNKSIIEYFKMVMDFDNESKAFQKASEEDFICELEKSLNNDKTMKKILWVS